MRGEVLYDPKSVQTISSRFLGNESEKMFQVVVTLTKKKTLFRNFYSFEEYDNFHRQIMRACNAQNHDFNYLCESMASVK